MSKYAVTMTEVTGTCKYCGCEYTVRVATSMAKKITNCMGWHCRRARKTEYARKRRQQAARTKTA